MIHNKNRRYLSFSKLFLVLFLGFLLSPFSTVGHAKLLKPTRNQALQCIRIIDVIEAAHYSRKKLDDDLSAHIFNQYFKLLDPYRHLFIQKDIDTFSKSKLKIDDDLKKGRLQIAYDIFNLYEKRAVQRTRYIESLISKWKKQFDFEKDEYLLVDNDLKPWQTDTANLFSIWRNELKNHIITLKLDGQEDKQITENLEKLYANRLKRIEQTEDDDVFQLFMNAVTSVFDPHTQYMPPRASEEFDIHMSRSLEGIGAVLQTEYEFTKVVRLIPKGPADKSALLMPGDKIIGVGQGHSGEMVDTIGQRIDHVVDLIRGPKNTYVRLKIIPAKKTATTKTIKILRDKVKLEEQSAKKKIVTISENNKTLKLGIIEIPTFYIDFAAYNKGDKNYVSTTRDVKRLIKELEKEHIDGLIIDLRDNGGGALQEASQLTGLFLKTGPTVQIRYQHKIARLYDEDPEMVYHGPMIVLINRMSASASEIFAGAIKDYHRGLIVGTRSFGKGTVQELLSLKEGRLKLTRAKFYRVSGESTQHMGVLPDITYPRIYDFDDTGESSLDGALPWDTTIRSLYMPYPDLDPIITQLDQKYQKRTKSDPGIIYLEKRIRLAEKNNGKKEISLNLGRRIKERKRLESEELTIENEYRAALDKPALKSLDDEAQSHDREDFKEILMSQTQKVMADFIALAKDYGYAW